MTLRLFLVLTVLPYMLATVAAPANTARHETKRSCSAIGDIAIKVATTLQSTQFNSALGYYNGNRMWTDANTIEDIYNLISLKNVNTWKNLIYQTQLGQMGRSHLNLWDLYFGGSYDDAGWALLLYIRIRDFIGSGDGNFQNFETSTSQVYDYVANQWSSDCGGGVWWSKAHDYKNTITNALFMHTSAAMYLRHRDKSAYLDNAVKTWKWLAGTGLRDSDNLWFDGMHGCAPTDRTKWTYNQGVIASGLGVLYSATGDTAYLTEAEKTLDAVVTKMTSGGILKEGCDDATRSSCNEDQLIFKGIFTKHLQYYIDQAGSAAANKYAGFLSAQSSGVHHYGTGSNNQPGSVWYAPNNGGSRFTARSMASGLEAHIAAGKYGNCW